MSTREILSHPRPLIPISLVFALANFLSWWARGYIKQNYPLLLLDERADMTDSVMLSADLTKGHRGVLLVAFLLPLFAIAVATSGMFQLAGIQEPGDAPLAFAAPA